MGVGGARATGPWPWEGGRGYPQKDLVITQGYNLGLGTCHLPPLA